jgi:adenylate cyclase
MAYYLLRRYAEAVDACNRGLARRLGRGSQMEARLVLAAAYAEMDRPEDAKRERALVARLWPFFQARTFVDLFGTEEAQNHVLEGLKKAGFR